MGFPNSELAGLPQVQNRAKIARRRRLGQSGAIAVEALAVAATMTLLLAGTLFLNAVYERKLDSLYSARAQAWEQAMPGCPWGGMCHLPELAGALRVEVQDRNVSSWSASLATETLVSCNEPAREQEDLNDAIAFVKRDIVGVGKGGWNRIGPAQIFQIARGVIEAGYEAAKCLYDMAREVTRVDGLVPFLALAIDYVLGLIL